MEVNRFRTRLRPISASTITSLGDRPVGEGDWILQMLVWLERTPESFVPGFSEPDSPRFQLPALSSGKILRWDTALFAALDERRRERALTWTAVAGEIGGFTPGMLTTLSKGGRVVFPRVMRLVKWLGRPAVAFTRVADW